jgi:hypothetical protein
VLQLALHGQNAGVLVGMLGLVHHHLEQHPCLRVLGIQH